MGDEHSKMRNAAIAAWNAALFDSTTVLTHGSICYEARKPVVDMSLMQGAVWCEKNEVSSLPLHQIALVPGLREDLALAYGANCRIVDITRLQGSKFHVASVRDLTASRHIQADENFSPDDVLIVRLDPPGCPIKPTFFGTEDLTVFEVVTDVTFDKLHYQLRRCGCCLASDGEYLDAECVLPEQANVFVRGDLMFVRYSTYNGFKELQGTNDSDSATILAGGYVVGKRVPSETKHTP